MALPSSFSEDSESRLKKLFWEGHGFSRAAQSQQRRGL